eukprot:Protomagalhaensia_sp_Gyna_25__313@NODE_1147_length_2137_cov_46_066254_g711_i1_p1_GENE_NODE_1147_length_2137_cov_46_066254_g711_i1NODE_1147_length_2137_cov_46_066254_g711_i1_p1_ORF_typecomplete_len138_score9_26_NODE_1147_length_2137_cov_46_066254_g711_i195508
MTTPSCQQEFALKCLPTLPFTHCCGFFEADIDLPLVFFITSTEEGRFRRQHRRRILNMRDCSLSHSSPFSANFHCFIKWAVFFVFLLAQYVLLLGHRRSPPPATSFRSLGRKSMRLYAGGQHTIFPYVTMFLDVFYM